MTGSTLARWNTSIVCPIPKKSSSVHIDAFCPIALTEMFRRIFEKCFLTACENSFSMQLVCKFSPM
ncbi:hypothetical protein DSO57_1014820 [Entomophthora muscae]|uniref:Uncharacterized protein n=1 Tax=Entomophthora muscae TaxID=34485 RepID=A0ACC2RJZ1_9FUNG|nr:hypothetical protein DSO57_1014820 [Entomophthora muscae]